jgi:hypothetical protein
MPFQNNTSLGSTVGIILNKSIRNASAINEPMTKLREVTSLSIFLTNSVFPVCLNLMLRQYRVVGCFCSPGIRFSKRRISPDQLRDFFNNHTNNEEYDRNSY